MQVKDDRRHGPPGTSQSETAITISDDSDTATGKKKGAAQQMPSPPVAAVEDTRKVTLPPSAAGAGEPEVDKAKGGDLRGTSMSPEARFRERERIRQNWGMRFRTEEANSSLPRRGGANPSFPKPWRGRGRTAAVTHEYSAEKA